MLAIEDSSWYFLKMQRRYFVGDCFWAFLGGARFGFALLLISYDESR